MAVNKQLKHLVFTFSRNSTQSSVCVCVCFSCHAAAAVPGLSTFHSLGHNPHWRQGFWFSFSKGGVGTDGGAWKEGDIEDDVLNGSTGADQDADEQTHQRH